MNKAFINKVLMVLSVVALGFSTLSYGQVTTTPSAAQIEQFKKLPKSQQKALAKQFGIDMSLLNQSGSTTLQDTGEAPEMQYIKNSTAVEDALEEKSIEARQKDVNKLQPFGYELFKNMQDAFIPSPTSSVPADYMVGPGDSINITLYGKESSSEVVTVDKE